MSVCKHSQVKSKPLPSSRYDLCITSRNDSSSIYSAHLWLEQIAKEQFIASNLCRFTFVGFEMSEKIKDNKKMFLFFT